MDREEVKGGSLESGDVETVSDQLLQTPAFQSARDPKRTTKDVGHYEVVIPSLVVKSREVGAE